ncbi:hypothetical protein Bca52824_051935 [Brassica carinata]|uniref:TAP42-like protein n=1 Tax=Brassica carinata TaxID=52824 RepID=A0A8X7R277_BRACI|nr:hypothetical protein Bca52824_051935 [Brassica carinata]
MAMEEMPLSALFEQARKLHLKASDSRADQDVVKEGCEMLHKCEDMVGKLGLFSSNETKEDISTNNLKYLLEEFCEAMELVPDDELEASSRGGSAPRSDPIARFKRQKAAESRLLEIKERKERLGRSTKAATLSTPVGSGEEEEEEDITDDDSEEERDAIDLMDNRVSAIKEQQLKNGEDEFSRDALDDRIKKAETWHRDTLDRASVSQSHEHKHQPMIFGPASIVNGGLSTEREPMIAQVFQPSHRRMPTMSIEDAGLTEMNIMNDWQEQTKKVIEEETTSWYNDKPLRRKEEDDDEDEEPVMKARAFDDWKDDNPRGAGNKKLTPCG